MAPTGFQTEAEVMPLVALAKAFALLLYQAGDGYNSGVQSTGFSCYVPFRVPCDFSFDDIKPGTTVSQLHPRIPKRCRGAIRTSKVFQEHHKEVLCIRAWRIPDTLATLGSFAQGIDCIVKTSSVFHEQLKLLSTRVANKSGKTKDHFPSIITPHAKSALKQ
ncbi:hypothetical protein BCR41DRAFT_413880 [Lobosporangium transversale]|uniref:Uncharacterized protein n=1 Tax=Lobosporangium transversale TaxID=64571 RepID=A0A1Y2GDW3_9FUNG|nr:hypothetical protein BCR41DRAFT_413880 [Lobosporangium transversale]ORZ05009.1 hypothetical protein BCR41DRAFT_413880 [Lobosporangium transversale]|eukprot:XP_021876873.1 hypothetical protein BCR41DRAFT_413880 [Lobosporangium transversale]